MNYIQHTVGGGVAAYGISYFAVNTMGVNILPEAIALMVGGAVVGALFCDIDVPTSKLGRKVYPLSNFLYHTVGHRTLTHGLPLATVLSILIARWNKDFAVGFFIGMVSHIILDLLTPKTRGVAFLYPIIKKKIRLF